MAYKTPKIKTKKINSAEKYATIYNALMKDFS